MSSFITWSSSKFKEHPLKYFRFILLPYFTPKFFFISCAFCIIEIIALPAAAILDGGHTASFLSLLLNLGPDLSMKIFPVGTFNV